MKSTFLRILVLAIASAALLRAMTGIRQDAKSTRSNSAEESDIAMWGFSPCGPDPVADALIYGASDFGVARVWQAESDEDLCPLGGLCVSAEEPQLASYDDLLNFKFTRDETGTGLWDIGGNGCDAPIAAPALRRRAEFRPDANQSVAPEPPPVRTLAEGPPDTDVERNNGLSCIGSTTVQFFPILDAAACADPNNQARLPFDQGPAWSLRRSEPDPAMDGSVRVDAVEFTRPAQVIVVGHGLKCWTRPAGIGGSDFSDDSIQEETGLMLVGGPAAIDALDRSASEGILPAVAEGEGSSGRLENAIFHASCYGLWWDIFERWSMSRPVRGPAWRAVGRLPLCAPGMATMSSLVTTIAKSDDGRHLMIAGDDGTLHLCSRSSGKELCRLKRSPDGVWHVVDTDARPVVEKEDTDTTAGARDELGSAGESNVLGGSWIRISDTAARDRLDEVGPPYPSGISDLCEIPPELDVWNVIRALSFVIL